MGAGQDELFDIPTEGIADGGLHPVCASAIFLLNRITAVVNDIDVIAKAANHGVGTGSAVEGVVQGIAPEAVVGFITRTVEGGTNQHQIFNSGAQGVVERGLNGVDVAAYFEDDIACGIDAIKISA
ncbi:DUF72 domain-containing protein [Microcystis aeruginosa 11-30S32]|uniref:DUF72 domain-containing protein n=1 Tax=Microcystis aeruginosa 11-30S32 TaxID=2358142 RepID=A0A510PQH5_MICAE|nr:DUF72 domain-containing protein [Microcystis aeruginosa 11-30S32]